MIETTVNLEEIRNPLSLPPGTVVGYRANGKPIYNIAGGDGRVEVDDNVDDDDDDVDDVDDSDEEKDEWVPPTKEEFDRILAAKAKADSEAAARKRFLREAGFDPKTGKPISKPKISLEDFDDDDDSDEAVEETRRSVKGESKAKSDKAFQRQLEREIAKTESRVRNEAREEQIALLAAVPTSLNDAGWNGKSLDRIIKLLDFDEIHIDSDGEIDGLEEQITSLKEDFPHFFKRARMKEAAKEVADTKTVGGSRKQAPPANETLSWTDRLKADLYRQ